MKTNPDTPLKFRLESTHAGTVGIHEIDFHGASIINEQGEEVPITEAMVQQACQIYIKQWEVAQKSMANS